ncbi:uncharacterized protein LOC144746878 [Ciona intestinalis]
MNNLALQHLLAVVGLLVLIKTVDAVPAQHHVGKSIGGSYDTNADAYYDNAADHYYYDTNADAYYDNAADHYYYDTNADAYYDNAADHYYYDTNADAYYDNSDSYYYDH